MQILNCIFYPSSRSDTCRGDLREGTAPNTFSGGGVRGESPRKDTPRWARRAAASNIIIIEAARRSRENPKEPRRTMQRVGADIHYDFTIESIVRYDTLSMTYDM